MELMLISWLNILRSNLKSVLLLEEQSELGP
jgi:hypothetical protein